MNPQAEKPFVEARVHYPSSPPMDLMCRPFSIGLTKLSDDSEPMYVVAVEQPNKEIMILDPRCVIEVEGQPVYDGRKASNDVGFPPDMKTWFSEHPEWPPAQFTSTPPIRASALTRTPYAGRNDSCPCGSGKKYKKCCGN